MTLAINIVLDSEKSEGFIYFNDFNSSIIFFFFFLRLESLFQTVNLGKKLNTALLLIQIVI